MSTSGHATADEIIPAFNAWRRSLAQLTGMGLTEEERASSAQAASQEKLKRECKRCESWRDTVIAESPIVRFMLQHVDSLPKPDYALPPAAALPDYSTQANSPVPIYCTPCGPARGGGFSPDVGVILCQDGMFSKKHVEDTLAHELVHEWDHRRFEVDWKDLRMVACSEIRAASLSGDCRWGREVRRRNFNFTKQHQACTRRRAVLSVLQHPSLTGRADLNMEQKEQEASRLVNEVWSSCWPDTRPFDEIF